MDSSSEALLPGQMPTEVQRTQSVGPTAVTIMPEIHATLDTPDAESVPVESHPKAESTDSEKKDSQYSSASDCAIDMQAVPTSVMPASQRQNQAEIPIGPNPLPVEESGESGLTDSGDNYWCLAEYGGFCNFYITYASALTESKYYVPFQIFLLGVPLSAGYMGASYMDECPMSAATPIILFMMGMLGFLCAFCRIVVLIRRWTMPDQPHWWIASTVNVFGSLFMLILLFTEMCSFLQLTPDFETGKLNYCDPIFYHYTYWLNIVFVVVIMLAILLHMPTCVVDSAPEEDEERILSSPARRGAFLPSDI